MPEQFISSRLGELLHRPDSLPEPSLLTRLRWRAENLKPARVRLFLETATARARRGWAPRDTWSLDGYLCRTLGAMLDHLAEHTHGWPQGPDFPEFADWQKALRTQAAALLAYEADDEPTIAPAQNAIHWVADNLPALWD
jgi:hypothetical protein